jgi:hypothetical protein
MRKLLFVLLSFFAVGFTLNAEAQTYRGTLRLRENSSSNSVPGGIPVNLRITATNRSIRIHDTTGRLPPNLPVRRGRDGSLAGARYLTRDTAEHGLCTLRVGLSVGKLARDSKLAVGYSASIGCESGLNEYVTYGGILSRVNR